MRGSWQARPLKECAAWYSGGTPSKARPEFWGGDIPWISAKSLKDFYVRDSDEKVTEAGAQSGTKLVPENSILFIVRGMSLKNEFRMGITKRPVTFNQDLKALVPVEDVVPAFLAYAIKARTPEILGFVGEAGHGTGVLPTDRIQSLEILLPSIDEQRRIARVLGSLDDKIELNRRMNQTLEAMAQAIFKSWFVDFDPVKAKAAAAAAGEGPADIERAAMAAISGKTEAELDGLPKNQLQSLARTAKLFPSALTGSALGGIPQGWTGSTVGDVAERVAMGPFGSRITRSNFVEQGVPVIRGGNLKAGFLEEGFVYLTEDKADELSSSNAFSDDIIFTHRGTIGQVGQIPDSSRHPRYVVSQSQMLLRANSEVVSSAYLYQHFVSGFGMRVLLSNASQVGVPAIARPSTSLKAVPIVIPPKELIDRYDEMTKPMSNQVAQNTDRSRTLAEVRDTLLPRLLSGKTRVDATNEGRDEVTTP